MKRRTITTLKWALPLAVVLAITGTGWAKKKTTFAPSVDGQLDPTRTIVTLSVDVSDVQCQPDTETVGTDETTTVAYSYSLKALLLQPSGRILAIGFSDPTPYDCVSSSVDDVMITAIQGQSFKPGLATVLYKMTETTTTTVTPLLGDPTTTVTTNVIEWGATVKLHP